MSSEIDNNKRLEENKKLAGKFIELTWNQGRFNLARNLVRRDFNYHVSLMNQTFGYDTTAQMIQMIRNSMEDFEVMIEDVIAEGDRVVTQSSFCGTLVKPMFGFQPSKNVVTFAAVSFWQIKKGQIQSLSTLLDTAELMRQMHHEGKELELDLAELEIG
ncbi:MAG: ester cyclase [Oleispira sp.]|nr:ester cyclase [Oleispira sp.]MBL4882562.1 ester cyclase [Oleispira sp.]